MTIRRVSLLLVLGALLAESSWAQAQTPAESESLCNPCVDPPVRPIRRNEFSSPNATTVVTPRDMRSLGVISVADMVNQLPNDVAESAQDEVDEDAETDLEESPEVSPE